jgi:hypothetical protein
MCMLAGMLAVVGRARDAVRAEATPAAGPCGCDHVRTYETNPTQVTGALEP